jgi:hypothetical protein
VLYFKYLPPPLTLHISSTYNPDRDSYVSCFCVSFQANKSPSETGQKYWYKITGASTGKAKKLLPPQYRKIFAQKQIVCVEYDNITDSNERDIFQVPIFPSFPPPSSPLSTALMP